MRKLAIAMALSSTVLAAPALARDGAPYAGAEFGAMIVEDIDFDIGTTDNALAIDHEYGYDGAIFVGYDMGMFRIELEASQKRADIDALQTTFNIGQDFGSAIQSQRMFDPAIGRTKIQSLMLNGLLDFGDDLGVSGFVGGGVGLARVDVEAGAFSNDPRGGIIDDRADGDLPFDSQFAWQVVAGVRQAITPNIDAHLKYRFFNADIDGFEASREATLGGGFDSDARIRTHSLLGGLTFNFGAPPPPPPVYVPPPPAYVPPPPPPPAYVPPPVQTQICPNGTVIPVTQTCPLPPPIPRAGERG